MNILVTGATGFIGQSIVNRLTIHPKFRPRAAVRRINHHLPATVEVALVGSLTSDTDWSAALQDTEVVVHTAGRAHVMDDAVGNSLMEFRQVNVEGTLRLARQAAKTRVKRFIFLSSIKVNGEETPLGKAFRAEDKAAPVDPYGISKMEAEQGLHQLARETGLEMVIIRPPLVYGPGVKANFLSMMHWLDRGIPLPLGAIHNKRSLVALDNLVDLVATCIHHPAAANQTFLAGDGEDLSTTELLQHMGKALGKPSRLIPIPAKLLEAGAILLGKKAVARRLCRSLQVNISKTRKLLNWTPPLSVDEGLQKTAVWFKGLS